MKTSLGTTKIDMDFPSKNYTKYKSQSKTNPFLNKLNQDIGYPEDVLKTYSTITTRQDKNYLDLNKKNLKNFFTDRLPPREVEIVRENFTLDPSRLFEIKKKQHQLKTLTRSKLEEKLDSTIKSGKLNPNKIRQNFQFNDKNEDFKRKFLTNHDTKINKSYDRENFLKGTTCYVQKYSKITKKQAYNSVFGREASAIPRSSITARMNRQDTTFTRPFTTGQDRQKYNLSSSSKLQQRKKFSSLIQKIDNHRQDLDPENKRGMKPYIMLPQQQSQSNQLNKMQMITWIKDTSKNYKYNSIHKNTFELKQIQDMQKLDSKFYEDMKTHKAKRLQHRQSYVHRVAVKNKIRQQSSRSNKNKLKHKDSHGESRNSLSQVSLNQQSQYSISSSQEEDDGEEVPFSPVSLLKKFIRLLVDALQQARYFGIQNKTNIYKAFWQNPDPYEKSGSYAFFKAIKKGDLQGIKKFINADYDFLYERDYKGRSPLICAVLNNHNDVIDYIMTCDINVNKICFNFRTALYYAIKNQNVRVVKKILQAGAQPWSSKRCSLSNICQKVKNNKITLLLKNARKIAILVQMQPTKPQKISLWNRLKHKINQNQLLTFE